jgi:simple sugar transport system substrate-binding protein
MRSERRVLSGQDIGHLDGPQGYYNYVFGLHERTGKWPALIGSDYLNHHGSAIFLDVDRKTRILAEYWKAGGLVTVYAHPGNPWTGGDAWDTSTGSGGYSDVYTPGTPAYARLQKDFDRLAGEFLKLQNAGAAVLFRPFHEVNGNWFWWHSKDPARYKSLWRHWFSYLTKTKGVHNLLFVFSPSMPPQLGVANPGWPWENSPWDYYPGADCVDIVGLSLYFDNPEAMPQRVYTEMIALGKPFGFGEMGQSIPPTPYSRNWDQTRIIRAIRKRYPAAAFWYSWSSWEPDGFNAIVDLPHAEELMNDPWVATREDVDFPRAVEASSGAPDASGAGRMKVGFIDCIVPQVRVSFSSFEAGWRFVQEKFGAWLEAVPVRGVGMYSFGKAVDRLVRQEGCSLIFTNAFPNYDQQVLDAAGRYPSVLFEAFQAGQAERPANLRICGIDDSDAQYLMGAIAGALTVSGRIGFIGWVPENWQIVIANEFALGVRATNPKARVFLRFAEGNPLEAAKALLAEGCDVFNYAADQDPILRLFEAAASGGKRIFLFGDSTPYEAYPDLIISSQSRNIGVLFERILADTRAGKEVPRDFWMGIRDGAVQLKAGGQALKPEVAAVLRQKLVRSPDLGEMTAYDFALKRFEQLRRGEYQPFTGPIRDQRGKLRLPEGVSNGSWEFKGKIDWLLDNVQGDLPKR